MPSLQSHLIRFLLSRRGRAAPMSIEERRAVNLRKSRRTNPPRDVIFSAATINGVSGLWAVPKQASGRSLLYLHGGGYCMGSAEVYRPLTGLLAQCCKTQVFVPDYRLAPEHPFPAGLDDAQAAYQGLLQAGTSPEDISLVGDSAGAGLALALLIRLRDAGAALPAAAVLLSGWFDLNFASETYRTHAERDLSLHQPELEWFAGMYIADDTPKNPLISPVYADLQGLPRLLLQVGEDELFFGENQQIAKAAMDAGVKTTLQTWANVPHVWHPFVPWLPESTQALHKIAAFLAAD